MSSNQMRKDFEQWLSDKYGKHLIGTWSESSQDYSKLGCTIAFEAYQTGAAATGLLEALELLMENHTQLVNCGDCGNWDVESEPAVIAARAAIARARGES